MISQDELFKISYQHALLQEKDLGKVLKKTLFNFHLFCTALSFSVLNNLVIILTEFTSEVAS